jgi:hypothetical protein
MSLENRGVQQGKADGVATVAAMWKTSSCDRTYLMVRAMLLVLDQIWRGFGNLIVRTKHGAAMREMPGAEDGLSRFVPSFETTMSSPGTAMGD